MAHIMSLLKVLMQTNNARILFKFEGSVGARQLGLMVLVQTTNAPTCRALLLERIPYMRRFGSDYILTDDPFNVMPECS